jgi:hypothetical protein
MHVSNKMRNEHLHSVLRWSGSDLTNTPPNKAQILCKLQTRTKTEQLESPSVTAQLLGFQRNLNSMYNFRQPDMKMLTSEKEWRPEMVPVHGGWGGPVPGHIARVESETSCGRPGGTRDLRSVPELPNVGGPDTVRSSNPSMVRGLRTANLSVIDTLTIHHLSTISGSLASSLDHRLSFLRRSTTILATRCSTEQAGSRL